MPFRSIFQRQLSRYILNPISRSAPPRIDPRRDGSVESVIIDRSSGLRDLDERVRRIVHLYAPYSAFPPDLARAYDVIEIRLVWVFADTLKIVEELR